MRAFVRVFAVAAIALSVTSARSLAAAIPDEVIGRAVDRGMAALIKMQGADGSFSGTTHGSGPTSLAALALLECGANPSDEAIRKAVKAVRDDCPGLNKTYNLALAILLLDRLDDPLDEPLIQALTVRLLDGQTSIGAWSYTTPDVSGEEIQKLKSLIERRPELTTVPDGPKPGRPPPAPDVLERAGKIEQRHLTPDSSVTVDNSNTQFALLGLWVGRRHGIATDAALLRAAAYFRATQNGGRWGYMPTLDVLSEARAANTCAGLLGLAIGTGLVREAQLRTTPGGKDGKPHALRDPFKDPVVQAAMNYVGGQVADVAAIGLNTDPNPMRHLYFLWSVERVGMVYGVTRMGGVDWYQIGAATILRAQLPDGSWAPIRATLLPAISGDIQTSFALLFLKRSNVARDLSTNLRKPSHPTTLRSGSDNGEVPGKTAPDAGASAGDAKDHAEPKPADAAALARELPTAAPDRQVVILGELRDAKGSAFTDALAGVIGKLSGDAQKKSRDALAERLARMTATTLQAKLKDANAEVRRAAALACAMRTEKVLVPDLVVTLDDRDVWVVRAAAVALHSLTGQDFGPTANATAEERAKSVAAWKAWWKRQNGG
jgi:hypothetical protein